VTTTVRIQTDSESLYVLLHGEGRAMLFVHGFPLDHTQWMYQVEGLEGWRVIAPDLRGAGSSTVPQVGYSMPRYADDLIAVLDSLGVSQAVCCGFSMGGYVLFDLWRRHPERIRALILCDTKAEADTPDGRRGRDELADLAAREGMGPVVEQLLPKLLGRTTQQERPALMSLVREMMQRAPVAGTIGALRAMRDRRDASSLLGGIRVPTLVVCGAEDVLTPPAVMQPLAQRIRGARYVEIPHAGHLSPLEQPDGVTRAIVEFLGTV
jgi:3-oxoadipate enol-lactonase